MARPEKDVPKTLEDAIADLKRDPSHPLRLAVSDVEVEMRLVGGGTMNANTSDDVLNGATWHGESAAELIQIIRSGREQDDPGEAPHL